MITSCSECKHFLKDPDDYPCRECENNFVYETPEYYAHKLMFEPAVDETVDKVVAETNEMVDHPAHYNSGEIECIDAMLSAYGKDSVQHFCLLNAFKYLWRTEHKNGKEDLDKAIWYIRKYLELEESNERTEENL